MSEKIRRHYVVKGRVQGVGFRYKAYYAAQAYRLTGYVRNMYSGDVEIEVQGNREAVDKFFEFAYRDRYIQIDDIKSKAKMKNIIFQKNLLDSKMIILT